MVTQLTIMNSKGLQNRDILHLELATSFRPKNPVLPVNLVREPAIAICLQVHANGKPLSRLPLCHDLTRTGTRTRAIVVLPQARITPRDQVAGKARDALQQEYHELGVLPRDVRLF